MKKYFVFIVMFFLIGGMSVQAQFKFGLKAGLNLSDASLTEVSVDAAAKNLSPENLAGFQVGPMIEVTIPAIGFGFDLAVLYSQQGMKLPLDENSIDFDKVKMNTLQVPVNLKFKLMLLPKLVKLYAAAGPYMSLNLSDKLVDQIESKSFGAGLNFGLGVELLSHLQIGANYQMGLSDDYSKIKPGFAGALKTYNGKTTMWSVTAAYLF